MPSRKEQRFRCSECYNIYPESELLTAPSPFDPSDELTGCPYCRSCAHWDHICDFDGCKKVVSSGTPMPDGDYVHRCLDHNPDRMAKACQPAP